MNKRFLRQLAGVAAILAASSAWAQTAPADLPVLAHGDGKEPAIHGPKVVGTTPGRPFLFLVPATGEGTLTYAAEGLPDGLSLDAKTGIITGSVKQDGEYPAKVTVSSALGKATRKLKIVAGQHKLAMTPPMGWNSWNVWARAVDDAKVRAAADAMVKSGLAAKGFHYVNIDDCWEGKRDANGEITSNEKFPDMKALTDYVHAKGLKIGLYSSPGPRTCAGFEASYQHEDQDAKTWAKWGFDYIKYDWCSYGGVANQRRAEKMAALLGADAETWKKLADERSPLTRKRNRTPEENAKLKELDEKLKALTSKVPEDALKKLELELAQEPYKVMRASLDKCGRDIVYSLCQYGMQGVSAWGGSPEVGGNLWRTTGDIRDSWGSMSGIGFRQGDLSKYAKPGQWNDPDMLVVGKVGWGPKIHPTQLTPNEQVTHITLWSLLAAPLLIGCDMTQMDPFTTDLLTNTEVLDVDQDELGKAATRVAKTGAGEVWTRPLADGTTAVGLFNLSDEPATITAKWSDIGVTGKQPVRDLWQRKDAGEFDGQFEAKVARHGAVLVKVGKGKE